MATVHESRHGRIGNSLHQELVDNDSTNRHDRLIDDDLHAGYEIPGILTGIIVFGLLSMVLSVLAILWSQS